MENKIDPIKALMAHLQTKEERVLEFDEEAMLAAYREKNDKGSLAIKSLSILGGFLASLAFQGFFFMTRLYDSKIGLAISGALCIVGAIWIINKYRKTMVDTFGIATYLIGYSLLGFGVDQLIENNNLVCLILILAALASLTLVRNYIISFISVLIINSGILTLLGLNNLNNLVAIYLATQAVALTYIYLKEGKLITAGKSFSQLYGPIRSGLTFSFLTGLIYFNMQGYMAISPHYIWPASLIIISAILYLVSILLNILTVSKGRSRPMAYTLGILILLPTALSPAISGAILIVLLGFSVHYRTGFALGTIAFIYFIGQFYYDLNFTLLTKSILLFSSGIFFIALYLFTHKKRTSNEKI